MAKRYSRWPVVGLFGTCDGVPWREPFISAYQKCRPRVRFYNPEVPPGTWDPKMAITEKHHLKNDDIILFPVLAKSWGWGSLGETGFSIKQALEVNRNRSVVVLIENYVDPIVKEKEFNLVKDGAWKTVNKHLESAEMSGFQDLLPVLEKANEESLKLVIDQMEKANLRARRLVLAHLSEVQSENVYVVDTLDEMFELSAVLYSAAVSLRPYKIFTPTAKFAKNGN